jgi:hypothetical protein
LRWILFERKDTNAWGHVIPSPNLATQFEERLFEFVDFLKLLLRGALGFGQSYEK